MSIDDLATIIATAVSLVTLLYTLLATNYNSRKLEQLRADFTNKQAERDARRDYEYEARKRLYSEFEPLFFQFFETARAARGQIYGLAAASRRGQLDPELSWLATTDSYYTLSLTYTIFAPLALGRLLQHHLTFFDLALDTKISNQYEALRRLSRLLSRDYHLANSEPQLVYDPNHPDAQQRRVMHPEGYTYQGIFAGYLDILLDNFLVSASDGQKRLLSFGEFVKLREEHEEEFMHRFGRAVNLFLHFHPATRPVLWRILIAQCAIYRWIRASVTDTYRDLSPQTLHEAVDERHEFDWRKPGEEVPDSLVLIEPFTAVDSYFKHNFTG